MLFVLGHLKKQDRVWERDSLPFSLLNGYLISTVCLLIIVFLFFFFEQGLVICEYLEFTIIWPQPLACWWFSVCHFAWLCEILFQMSSGCFGLLLLFGIPFAFSPLSHITKN